MNFQVGHQIIFSLCFVAALRTVVSDARVDRTLVTVHVWSPQGLEPTALGFAVEHLLQVNLVYVLSQRGWLSHLVRTARLLTREHETLVLNCIVDQKFLMTIA